jgi:nitric oxide reductase NorD protein
MNLPPFTFAEIEERLEDVSVELDEDVITKFTEFDIQTQDDLLGLIEKASSTSHGLAFQLGKRLPHAIELMELETLELWLNQAIDAFDNKGLYSAVEKLNELESIASFAKEKLTGIPFEDICGVLEPFVIGLNGRKLNIDTGSQTYTDTETLYLPSMLNYYSEKQDNFILYKCMAVHLWAQTWFGTWRIDLQQSIESFKNRDKAIKWFQALETIRLDACIKKELPGIHREMQRLCKLADITALADSNIPNIEILLSDQSTVEDSLKILEKNYHLPPPSCSHYHGCFNLEEVTNTRNARLLKEKDLFRKAIAHIIEEKTGVEAEQLTEEEKQAIDVTPIADPDMPDGFTYQLQLDGDPVEPPDGVKSLMDSIIQDIGLIPDDYLVAAGDGGYKITENDDKVDNSNVWSGTYHEDGAFLHKEWDYKQQRYKKNWCAVRELEITPIHNNFIDDTLVKYSGLVKNLRKTFEVLRGEDKILKKQPYGDDIDIDALVETLADVKSGMEMSERIFTKMHKEERNIAVIFMVDMSGSTKGWINEAERESLILLCEALETLGDRYAIYGFSGTTRKRCEVFRIKNFDDQYDRQTKGRICNIQPQEYTRLGVFIRHFTEKFNDIDAKTKLLITLSDGKPEDYDGYRGEYGIEDTRIALQEAQREGIHSFCITIDSEARDYLPHMYGAANYIVLDEVSKLPLKVSDIYRRITS